MKYETNSWIRLSEKDWKPIAGNSALMGWEMKEKHRYIPLQMLIEINPESQYDARFVWFCGFMVAFVNKPMTIDVLAESFNELEPFQLEEMQS